MPELLDFHFRPSSRYQLVRLEQLAEVERDTLKDLGSDPDFYGLLVSENRSLSPRAISQETALLLLSLGQGSPIPDYFRHRQPDDAERHVRELVVDGALEIKLGDRFLSGASASQSLGWFEVPELNDDAISRLTIDAMRYAETLEGLDATSLSARLYFYNRIPLTPEAKLKYRAERKMRNVLGLSDAEPTGAILGRLWSEVRLTPPNDGWLMWQYRGGERLDSETRPTFKLYISPTLEALPAAFAAVVRVLTQLGGPRFKVGRNVFGVLRPDKIVAYFGSEEALLQAADLLAEELRGVPAHGVPFSASFDDGGLISWGVDPPKTTKMLAWQETETWRLWLTNRVAVALLQARADNAPLPPWQCALQRLERHGVDVTTWTMRGDLDEGETA